MKYSAINTCPDGWRTASLSPFNPDCTKVSNGVKVILGNHHADGFSSTLSKEWERNLQQQRAVKEEKAIACRHKSADISSFPFLLTS